MTRPLFNLIVNKVTNQDAFFRNNIDCTGREGISALIKCTYAIRQLAYGVNVAFLDEYMQISERTSRTALDHFCQAVMDIYGAEYLRKPTVTDIEKLYRHHEEKHGFPGMERLESCSQVSLISLRPFHENGLVFIRMHLELRASPECDLRVHGLFKERQYVPNAQFVHTTSKSNGVMTSVVCCDILWEKFPVAPWACLPSLPLLMLGLGSCFPGGL
ncbi:hypothetical protein Tco_1257626 [Tanacetum coccineum]